MTAEEAERMDSERRMINAEMIRRIDGQDRVLEEIKSVLEQHIKTEKVTQQNVEELVLLWRGSKMILPAIAGILAFTGGAIIWFKDHLK